MLKILPFFLCTCLMAFGQSKLVKKSVTDGIVVQLPTDFISMTPSDLAQRYPSVRKPLAAFTDQGRLTDFSVKVSATKWRSADVVIAKDFFKAGINNLFDRVTFYKDEIQTIDDKQFIVFEFDSRINGEMYSLEKKDPIRKYHYVQYLLINGKTLVFSFTTHIQLKEQWQAIAAEIMASVKVKNNI